MQDRFVLKRIGVVSMGTALGGIYAVIGLIFGSFMTLFSLIGAAVTQSGMGVLFGIGSIIILPIFYGLAGFIGGVITAFVYNFVAGVVGGVEIELG